MARFIVKEETSTKLVLEINPAFRKPDLNIMGCFTIIVSIPLIVSTLIFLFINRVLGWAGFFITGCLAIYVIYLIIRMIVTMITIFIDLNSGKATRIESIRGRTTKRIEVPLTQVKNIYLSWSSGHGAVQKPESETQVGVDLILLDKSGSFEVNNMGNYSELKPFAEKLAAFLDKPLEELAR